MRAYILKRSLRCPSVSSVVTFPTHRDEQGLLEETRRENVSRKTPNVRYNNKTPQRTLVRALLVPTDNRPLLYIHDLWSRFIWWLQKTTFFARTSSTSAQLLLVASTMTSTFLKAFYLQVGADQPVFVSQNKSVPVRLQ